SHGREYLETIINSIEDEIIVIDKNYRILLANKALLKRIKKRKEDVIGKLCYRITKRRNRSCGFYKAEFSSDSMKGEKYIEISPEKFELKCPAVRSFEKGISFQDIYEERNQDGNDIYFEVFCSPMLIAANGQVEQVVEVSRDITQRKKIEQQLIQAERLISMGKLSASVAHEINNPISGILVLYELLLKRLKERNALTGEDKEEFIKYLNLMKEETARCAEITHNLLAFSRQKDTVLSQVDLRSIVRKSVLLIQHKIALENIKVVESYSTEAVKVLGDRNQLQQVFLNIIENAAQSMTDGGELKVKVNRYPEGDTAVVEITDTGCGIKRKDMDKIFDPFFTTKKEGKGTGLGLSVVYGIIKNHGGSIRVKSRENRGSSFFVNLPLVRNPISPKKISKI
ncbi:MAG: nitrogen regulation protein NR(II), partial [Fidelibacterota bacterium]